MLYSIAYKAPGADAETPVYRAGDFLGALDCRRAVYTTGVNSAWSLALTIGPDNPAYTLIEVMRGEFRVRDADNTLVFRGRPWRVSRSLDGALDIDVEGLLAVLSDVEFSGYQFSGSGESSITNFLTDLIVTKFDPYMTEDRKIGIGSVTVSSPAFSVAAAETDPVSAWSILLKYTVEMIGGYLYPDYSSADQIGINYVAALPDAGQEIALAQNLVDFEAERDGSSLITHLFPRGKDGLSINSIANGTYSGIGKQGSYLYDAAARDKYGTIVRYIDFPELETAQDVLDAGIAVMLAQSGRFVESITLTAVDLSLSSDAFSEFSACTMVTVREKLGQSASYPLTEMSVDLVNPGQSTITLNNTRATISSTDRTSGSTGGGGSIIASGVSGVKGEAESAYRTGNVNITKANIGLGNVLDDEQLPAAGGTMTGTLQIKSDNLEAGTTPSSGTTGKYIRFADKNDVTLASIYPYISANGRASVMVSPRLAVDGTTVYNELQLGVNPDGSRLVWMSDAAAWRSALGTDASPTSGSVKLVASGGVYDAIGSIPFVGTNMLIDSAIGDVSRGLFDGSTATVYGTAMLDGSPCYTMDGGKYIKVNFPELEVGQQYVFSCDIARQSGGSTKDAYITIDGNDTLVGSALGGVWTRFDVPFVATDTSTSALIRINNTGTTVNGWVGHARRFKLECGSKATDWTPAPDDCVSKYGSIMTGPVQIASDGSTVKVLLQETSDGRGNIQLLRSGIKAVNMYTTSSGGEVDICDSSGNTRAALFVDSSGNGQLRLYASDGSYASITKATLQSLLNLI